MHGCLDTLIMYIYISLGIGVAVVLAGIVLIIYLVKKQII